MLGGAPDVHVLPVGNGGNITALDGQAPITAVPADAAALVAALHL